MPNTLNIETNSVCYPQYILNSLENKMQDDSVYKDFSRAFDSINHGCLSPNLHGSLLRWFERCLLGTVQRIKFKKFVSDAVDVLSRVPQCSHLGPILKKHARK